MNLNVLKALALAAFVAAMAGCGGGGGGTGGGGGGGGGGGFATAPYPGQYIEFVSNTRAGTNLDPMSLQVGDDVKLVLANYDASGKRTTPFHPNTWACTANSSEISVSTSGHLIVVSQPTGTFQVTVSQTVAGIPKDFEQDVSAPTYSTTISGKVVADGTNAPAKYIQVNFYDQSGASIAGARTMDGGNFVARVPSNVYSVSIKGDTVPNPPYYRSFIYGGKVFTMDASTCPVKLSGIVVGQNNTLPSKMSLYLQENGPPPPPDGCGP